MLSGSPHAALARHATYRPVHTTDQTLHTTEHTTDLSHTALVAFALPVTTAGTVKFPARPNRHLAAPPVPPVVTPPPPPPPPPPPVPVTDANSVNTPDWMCIRIHESGDRYNSPAAPSGAYGILLSTWQEFGYSGWPYQAPASVQDALALRLHQLYGFEPWSSRFACGL
jgi:hypothetical protein